MVNVIDYSFSFFSFFLFSVKKNFHQQVYIIKCYLFREGVIFLSFTLKLMLLFIIMNMSNSRVYFMRQNASVPTEYAVTQGRSSVPRSVARAHCDPSVPIAGCPHPSYTVRAMSFVVLAHCHPSVLIGVPFAPSRVPSAPSCVPSAPSCVPSAPSCVPSSPSHLPSARTRTSPRPFAFHPHVQEEVRAYRLRSTHAWVQYKRRGATARGATISLYFTAWNSALSSLRETTYVDMALVGC
jgi:hypothetical protein